MYITPSAEAFRCYDYGKSEAVVESIQAIRDTRYAPTYYNDEQALRYVIKFAYIAAIEQYLKIEELPSGKGIARDCGCGVPAEA